MPTEPNWLIAVGLIYLAVASGFLALSATSRADFLDASGRAAAEGQQRVAIGYAGVVGMIGFGLQTLGQFVHVGEGVGMVLLALGVIGVMVAFVRSGDRADGAQRLVASVQRMTTHAPALSLHSTTPSARLAALDNAAE